MTTEDASAYCLVMVTVSSESEGKTIAMTLLDEKLAACINIFPLTSYYVWSGKINQDREWQLSIKTRLALFDDLANRIKTIHSYDVPEIIALPLMAGSSAYLNWIKENTQKN